MSSPIAEEIRNLIHMLTDAAEKLQEESDKKDAAGNSAGTSQEKSDDAASDDSGKSVDSLLTDKPGIEKIEGSFNLQELINILDLPKEMETNFRSAMYAIRSQEDPHLTKPQAMALATAFDHVLLLSTGKKQQFLSKVKSLSPDQGG